MSSYEQYEKECNRIRGKNKLLLKHFQKWLSDSKLSSTTVKKHVSNVDFYINEFLLNEDTIEAAEGVGSIGMFLGYWFIRKAMWASTAAIKANAASLTKFYQYMLETNKITSEALQQLKCRIKDGMPEWLGRMERYDDPDIEDPEEIWGR